MIPFLKSLHKTILHTDLDFEIQGIIKHTHLYVLSLFFKPLTPGIPCSFFFFSIKRERERSVSRKSKTTLKRIKRGDKMCMWHKVRHIYSSASSSFYVIFLCLCSLENSPLFKKMSLREDFLVFRDNRSIKATCIALFVTTFETLDINRMIHWTWMKWLSVCLIKQEKRHRCFKRMFIGYKIDLWWRKQCSCCYRTERFNWWIRTRNK